MPKYLILKHYNGGPARHENCVEMSEWSAQDVKAHIDFQHHIADMLRERGEFVDAQALSPAGTYVQYGGPNAAPKVDGPFPEAKELIAGWFVIDVESEARAHEVAAYVSSAPGKGGEPVYEWLEVRPFMDESALDLPE